MGKYEPEKTLYLDTFHAVFRKTKGLSRNKALNKNSSNNKIQKITLTQLRTEENNVFRDF